jgi:biotin carboxyl carrier protein
MNYDVSVDGKTMKVEVEKRGAVWACRVDGKEYTVDAALTAREVMSLLVDGKAYEAKREHSLAGELHLVMGSERFAVEVKDPRSLRSRRSGAAGEEGPQKLLAPMPGKVIRVLVKEGDEVEKGKGVLVVEAMKMQNEIKSPKKGVVKKISVAEGSAVNAGDVLTVIE